MHDDARRRSFHDWLQLYVRTPDTPGFATRHLDELVWEDARGDDLVAYSLACLREALAIRDAVGALGVDVRLALPLRESESMDRRTPSWASLQADKRELEPPSIYISGHPGHFAWAFPEEYRAPLPAPADLPGGAAYYVCARDEHAAALGWEFSRTVWVHAEST